MQSEVFRIYLLETEHGLQSGEVHEGVNAEGARRSGYANLSGKRTDDT